MNYDYIVLNRSYTVTPCDITRIVKSVKLLTYASLSDIEISVIYPEDTFTSVYYDANKNTHKGLSVYSAPPSGPNDNGEIICKLGLSNNFERQPKCRSFRMVNGHPRATGKSTRYSCYYIPKDTQLPEGWVLIFDKKNENVNHINGFLHRTDNGDLPVEFLQEMASVSCNLEDGISSISECFQLHCNQYHIKAAAEPRNFVDSEMQRLYEYVEDWTYSNYYDCKYDIYEKEISEWFAAHKWGELENFRTKYHEIFNRFNDWLEDIEIDDEQAKILLQKLKC